MTCGCGESEYDERSVAKIARVVKRNSVAVNFIAIDFMVEYDPEADDPEKGE